MKVKRALVLILVFGFSVTAGTVAASSAAKPKPPKPIALNNGFYSGASGNTGVIFLMKKRKITSISVTMRFKFDGGGICAPIGTALNFVENTAYFDVDRMSPVKPNRQNRFRIPISQKTSGLALSSGWVKGRLISSKKMSVSVKFRQAANHFQGACSASMFVGKVRWVAPG